MKLYETVRGMTSSDYKERFIAEYQQICIRCEGLKDMLYKYEKRTLDFNPSSSYQLLECQLTHMENYKQCLEIRSLKEEINIFEQGVNPNVK